MGQETLRPRESFAPKGSDENPRIRVPGKGKLKGAVAIARGDARTRGGSARNPDDPHRMENRNLGADARTVVCAKKILHFLPGIGLNTCPGDRN